MTHFIKTGDTIKLAPTGSIEVSTSLPAGTYAVKQNPQTLEYYLQTTAVMGLPPKLYGNSPQKRVDRIIKSFNDRSRSTGVLLSGEKGSGKTLLTKMLANKLMATGTPVILISEAHCGADFNKLITDITTPCVIVFDEFEKVYDRDDQEVLLTLLDGTAMCKHLYVLTTNSTMVSNYLLNRPGRVYYAFEYGSLEPEVVVEYATQNLSDKTQLQGLLDVVNLFTKFNFDMLQALVEEMNRFDESAAESVSVLNVSPRHENVDYTIVITVDGAPLPEIVNYYPKSLEFSPLATEGGYTMQIRDSKVLKLPSDGDESFELSPATLTTIQNGGEQVYKFTRGKKEVLVTLKKQVGFKYAGMAF